MEQHAADMNSLNDRSSDPVGRGTVMIVAIAALVLGCLLTYASTRVLVRVGSPKELMDPLALVLLSVTAAPGIGLVVTSFILFFPAKRRSLGRMRRFPLVLAVCAFIVPFSVSLDGLSNYPDETFAFLESNPHFIAGGGICIGFLAFLFIRNRIRKSPTSRRREFGPVGCQNGTGCQNEAAKAGHGCQSGTLFDS